MGVGPCAVGRRWAGVLGVPVPEGVAAGDFAGGAGLGAAAMECDGGECQGLRK